MFVLRKKKVLFWSVLVLSFVLFGCGNEQESKNDGKINVVTTIAQIGEPLSVIGGDLLEVKSLMGPAVDPHLYKATHGDIRTMEEADLVFYNGLHLEANMVDIFKEMGKSKPVMGVAETIPEDLLLYDEYGSVDPHIWFDIDLWKQALHRAVEKLQEYAPKHRKTLEKNMEAYFEELDQLKEDAKKLATIPEEKRVLITAHDAFGYFGRMHNIKVVGLQGLSTDAEIGLSDIQDTIDIIIEYKVPAVFVESSVNEDAIRAVIEGAKQRGLEVSLGGELFSDAMGEPGTEKGTYIGMYRHNVDVIYKALNGGGN